MSDIAIKVENISKLYRLGEVGTGTLSHDLNRWWQRVRGKEDPYLKLGEENKRDAKGGNWVWALKEINFEVKQGKVMGVIGKNGAGKSTLLKLLSRVTAPTTGEIKAKGRIASLLEVGTGFHPELTGKENIFLNGAILGMTRNEIKRKFNEIVEFAGVERYIDTPVKRYSSGMYVRLAFAVAAHLEPEILIIDEVLAVGDAEFQKKCLGKIKDVSDKEGRTVLFVSHNMAAIKSLCDNAVLLENGLLTKSGSVNSIVDHYLNADDKPAMLDNIPDSLRTYSTGEAFIKNLSIKSNSQSVSGNIPFKSPLVINIEVEVIEPISDLLLDIKVVSKEGIELSHSQSNLDNLQLLEIQKGGHTFEAVIENNFQPGAYYLTVGIHHSDGTTIDYLENILGFEVLNISYSNGEDYNQNWKHGYFRPKTTWSKT